MRKRVKTYASPSKQLLKLLFRAERTEVGNEQGRAGSIRCGHHGRDHRWTAGDRATHDGARGQVGVRHDAMGRGHHRSVRKQLGVELEG